MITLNSITKNIYRNKSYTEKHSELYKYNDKIWSVSNEIYSYSGI